jgi:hypothetical protein
MKAIMSVLMSVALFALCSCANSPKQNSRAELSGPGKSVTIRTGETLSALLGSIEVGEVEQNVTLIGKLDLGTNPKLDPAKLRVGNSAVLFGHYLDKQKYDGQTVLIKADIVHNAEGKTDAQVLGHMIVNVQHVEIVEQP